MILHRILSILIASSFFVFIAPIQPVFPDLLRSVRFSSVVCAQDLSKTVLPITQFKIKPELKLKLNAFFPSPGLGSLKAMASIATETDLGTGFCVDPECRFIGTNYHVAVMAQPRKIKGDEVIDRYLATGPDDEGATLNDIFSERPLKYVLSRDVAIYELMYPLRQYHGIPFSLDDLERGQGVDIYAYSKESFSPIRKLLQFHGVYMGETVERLLAFNYSFSDGKPIRGGESGGLVVDSKTHRVVGILCRANQGKDGSLVAMAVPIQSLADFVNKVQPWLAQSIFPSARKENISPTVVDLYPKFEEPHIESVQQRPEDSAEVKLLREKAQSLVDGMRDFIAVQTVTFGSGASNNPYAWAEYEIQVVDGRQKFREYPDGKKEFVELPLPGGFRPSVGTGTDWADLPGMVGKIPKFKIHQFPDSIVDGHRIKVFQYRADVEDDVCGMHEMSDFILFTKHKYITSPCYGEVWTDEQTNILRVSEHDEHLELYGGKFRDTQSVVTYGWLRRTNEAPRLIPLTITVESVYGKKLYWCRGQFINYREFKVQTKIGKSNDVPSIQ